MIPSLTTRRLVLRQPCTDDAAAIARYLNNFAVAGNLARVPYPYALADAERWLRGANAAPAPEETGFAIELPGAGYIGQIGFHVDDQSPTIGYWLGEPFWHRGLMSEAVAAAIAWYFGLDRGDTIYSGVFHFNKASLAVQRKLGFTETGTSQRHCLARGEQVRHIDTQLSRGQWKGVSS
ncbi:MAG: GNAT family N-acetyltransferase [Devosia sp.]|nr:GNAT family N-acetyltransferase [Devosia sp.]